MKRDEYSNEPTEIVQNFIFDTLLYNNDCCPLRLVLLYEYTSSDGADLILSC